MLIFAVSNLSELKSLYSVLSKVWNLNLSTEMWASFVAIVPGLQSDHTVAAITLWKWYPTNLAVFRWYTALGGESPRCPTKKGAHLLVQFPGAHRYPWKICICYVV